MTERKKNIMAKIKRARKGTEETAEVEETGIVDLGKKYPAVIKQISEICKQKKELEAQEKQLKESLKEAMEEYDVKSFDNDLIKVVYVAPTTRTTIDSARLKKAHPDLVEEFSKTSSVSSSIRITVK